MGNIVPDEARRKRAKCVQITAAAGKLTAGQMLKIMGSLLTVRYIRPSKNDGADSLNHRQIRSEVYTHSSGSNLRLNLAEEVSNGHSGTSR